MICERMPNHEVKNDAYGIHMGQQRGKGGIVGEITVQNLQKVKICGFVVKLCL
jgi:hypothetical protein